jgi:hypothetical protein
MTAGASSSGKFPRRLESRHLLSLRLASLGAALLRSLAIIHEVTSERFSPPSGPPVAVDLTDPGWPASACDQLKKYLYARLRLPPREVQQIRELYSATKEAFDCASARRQLRIPHEEFGDLDARNGFVCDPNREWLELHTSYPTNYEHEITAPQAQRLVDAATEVAQLCRGVRLEAEPAPLQPVPFPWSLRGCFPPATHSLSPARGGSTMRPGPGGTRRGRLQSRLGQGRRGARAATSSWRSRDVDWLCRVDAARV